MHPLLSLAPFWLLFEIAQLVFCERFLGIKQIHAGIDPRQQGPREWAAFAWVAAILAYTAWMLAALFSGIAVPQLGTMLAVTLIGFGLRAGCGLKWVLVILTFEGAIRIGMLLSISVSILRRL